MRTSRARIFLIFHGLVLSAVLPLAAQLVPGQYEDEAPLGTWNAWGTATAASLGLGGARLALGFDASAGLINPALLVRGPKFSATISAAYVTASLFRYSLVNTGVVDSLGNLSVSSTALDFGGLAFRWRRWAVALCVSLDEIYDRPGIDIEENDQGQPYYSLEFTQTGFLRNFHISLARDLGRGFQVGLGINAVDGQLRREILERWIYDGVSTSDLKTQDFRGYFLNAGLAWEAFPGFTAALAVRTPYVRSGDGRSSLHYDSAAGGTEIVIDSRAKDELKMPWAAGLGLSYRFSEDLVAALDLTLFGWSRYAVTSFEESLSRDFRNVLKAGAGVEYASEFRLFGRNVRCPLRAGVSLDPQPMRTPSSSYASLTLGTGLQAGRFRLDGAAFWGWEKGSGRSLQVRRAALTLTYLIAE